MEKFNMEIQDRMNYFALKISNQMLHCILFFKEHLEETMLAEAIRCSMKKDQILGCRIVQEENTVYWESREEKELSVICEVSNTTDIQKELEEYLLQEVDPSQASLIQARIFRNEGDCLCIKMSHTICDAGGLKAYVRMLADFYTELMNKKEIRITKQATPDRSQKQIFEHLEPKAAAALGDQAKAFFRSAQPIWSFPSKGYQRQQLSYVIKRIDSKLYEAIVAVAKENNATLNDMLLTAFCCALQSEGYPPELPMLVQVPIDLRRYIDDKKALPICNLSGAEYLNIILDHTDFMYVLEKVQQAMQAIKANNPGLTSAFAQEGFAKVELIQARSIIHDAMDISIQYNVSIPIVTNMGIITEDCKKFGALKAYDGYLVSPVMYAPGFMLGISSFGHTLTFTIGFSEASSTKEHIQNFISRMIAELEQSCRFRIISGTQNVV